MNKLQVLKEILKEGKENAVTNADLQQIMHTSRREVSQMIHLLREQGSIICGDSQGYYKPQTDNELIQGYDVLWKKAVSNLAVLKAMRREIKKRNLLPQTAEATARQARRQKHEG